VQDQVLVTVRPRINLFAGNDTSVVYNQLLQLNAVSNGLLFRWTPATALSAANIPNPTAVFRSGILPPGTDTIRYTVTASTPEGCSATDNLLVKVFSTAPTVFVPSAFTPNADGRNDLMRPTLAGMRELSFFRIYNRYGQLVFETRTPGRGWDGKLNGVLQNSGVFVYQCQAIDFEGNTSVVKGSFVLVR
jgi:gliding motility-associated-like protein